MDLIYSRLLKVQDDLSFQPDLAESWEVSEDATIYTFKIREGITWTDGEPFTIDDIIFTYKLALTPETGASQAGQAEADQGRRRVLRRRRQMRSRASNGSTTRPCASRSKSRMSPS